MFGKRNIVGLVFFIFLSSHVINGQICNPPTDAQQNQQVVQLSSTSTSANSITLRVAGDGAATTGAAVYINTEPVFTNAPNVISSANSGKHLNYSGSGQQLVVAEVDGGGAKDYTITGLSANTVYYFKIYAIKICQAGTQPAGTVPMYGNDHFVHPKAISFQATTGIQTTPLLSVNDFTVSNTGNVTLRAGINTSQTVSYSIVGANNGYSLSGTNNSTLTVSSSVNDGATVKIRATALAVASSGFPAVSRDFLVTKVRPLTLFYTENIDKLKMFREGRVTTLYTGAQVNYPSQANIIGNYLWLMNSTSSNLIRYDRDGGNQTSIALTANLDWQDRLVGIQGGLWGTLGTNRTIFKADADGSNMTTVKTFGNSQEIPYRRLVDYNGKVYGVVRYESAINNSSGFIFSIEYDGSGYTKVVDIPSSRLLITGLAVDQNASGESILSCLVQDTNFTTSIVEFKSSNTSISVRQISSNKEWNSGANWSFDGFTVNNKAYYVNVRDNSNQIAHDAGNTAISLPSNSYAASRPDYFNDRFYVIAMPFTPTDMNTITSTVPTRAVRFDLQGNTTDVFTFPNVNYNIPLKLHVNHTELEIDGGRYDPEIVFDNFTMATNQTITLNAHSPSDGAITYSIIGAPNGATIDGNKLTANTTGTLTIRASIAESSDRIFNVATKDITVTVKQPQTISFSAISNKPLDATTFTLHATSSTGLPVTYFSSDTSVVTINNSVSPPVVTMLKKGNTSITASVAENSTYATTSAYQPVTILKTEIKGDQTIHFGSLAEKTYGDANFNLTGVSDAGISVSYASSNTNVATISGNTVTIVGAGSTNITASALSNTNYNVAPTVQRTLTVNKRAITITPDSNQRKDLGDADPALTYTVTTGSLVSGDTSSNSFTGGLSRAAGEAIGNSYAINLGTLASAKYAITLASTVVNFQISKGAGQILWDGSAGNIWGTGSNWEGDATPGSSTDVVIPGGVPNTPMIPADIVAEVGKLGVQASATLEVDKKGAVVLSSNLNNLGTITLKSDGTDSSVLIVGGTSNGNVTYERGGFQGPNNGFVQWSIVSAPVAGQKISDFVNDVSNRIAKGGGTGDAQRWAVAKFDYSRSAGQHWQYYTVGELKAGGSKVNDTFTIGDSYAIARTEAGSVRFTGTLEVADVNKTVAGDQWIPLGNPYTAFIAGANGEVDNNTFIKDNESVFRTQNKAVYVWKNLGNIQSGAARYEPVSLSDNVSLTPGQGFILRTSAGGNKTITFNRSRRSTKPTSGSSGFNRMSNTTPNIELKASLNGLTILTKVRYFENSTLGLDPGYDVADFGPDRFDLYTKLLDGYEQENFAIQALPANNYQNMVIPIGLIADSGSQITFSAEVLNLPAGIEAYLEDRALGTFTNLSKQNASYMVTLNAKVNGHGRFYLRTMSSSLSNGDNPELLGVKVYTTDANTLMIQGIDSEEARMEMYSVIGTQVLDTKFRGTGVNQIKLPGLASGIYIVRLATEKGTIQKKIVLE